MKQLATTIAGCGMTVWLLYHSISIATTFMLPCSDLQISVSASAYSHL